MLLLQRVPYVRPTVSCLIWEGDEVKKVDLTVLDVGWTIIKRVDRIPETADYMKLGVALSTLLLLMPCAFRVFHSQEVLLALDWTKVADLATLPELLIGQNWRSVCNKGCPPQGAVVL